MPVPTHTKAADDHKSAAQAHQSAAELHQKGDHSAAPEKSAKAMSCCDTAQRSTMDAHGKSAMHAKK